MLLSAIAVETFSPAGDIKNCYIYLEPRICFSYVGLVHIDSDRKVTYYVVEGNSNLLYSTDLMQFKGQGEYPSVGKCRYSPQINRITCS